jgi:hypothetical protein
MVPPGVDLEGEPPPNRWTPLLSSVRSREVFDGLVSFTYNLGSGALQRSNLRRKVNREEHGTVPAEFHKWVWAGGRKPKGLVRRREAEAALYGSRQPQSCWHIFRVWLSSTKPNFSLAKTISN